MTACDNMDIEMHELLQRNNCMALQYSPIWRLFMDSSIFNPLLKKHLVSGQCQKAPNVSATNVPDVIFSLVTTKYSGFYWSAFHNHEGSTFTEKDRNKLNYRIGPKRT